MGKQCHRSFTALQQSSDSMRCTKHVFEANMRFCLLHGNYTNRLAITPFECKLHHSEWCNWWCNCLVFGHLFNSVSTKDFTLTFSNIRKAQITNKQICLNIKKICFKHELSHNMSFRTIRHVISSCSCQ